MVALRFERAYRLHMVNETTVLLSRVRRYSVAPGILFGAPSDLALVCKMLGFRSACARGKVYITPTKIGWLAERGLAAPLAEGAPAGYGSEAR